MIRTAGLHERLVHPRRVRVLAETIAPLVERGWRVVDLGCGDGRLASLIADQVPDLSIQGFELAVRRATAVPVLPFDGRSTPLADKSVDAALLVDVLHHTPDPMVLLREADRIARRAVIIKDHRLSRPWAAPVLRFMDWVGNRAHDVALPFNYWSLSRWRSAWNELNLNIEHYQTRIGLYPCPLNWLFESGLHFVARLKPGFHS